MNNKYSRLQKLRTLISTSTLMLEVWSPGDGRCRYNFTTQEGRTVHSAVGYGEALTFAKGYMTAKAGY